MASINTSSLKYPRKDRRWRRWGYPLGIGAIAASLFLWLSFCPEALARKDSNPPPEPQNPLELKTPDPLLPNPPKDGRLNAEESQQLTAAMEELNAEANAMLAAGNTKEAFNIWNRELRLRRFLGPLAEVQALSRVGSIAWRNEQINEIQIINQRLEAIQLEFCTATVSRRGQVTPPLSCDLMLLEALGTAFEQLRSRNNAVTIYQQILADARSRQDILAEEAALKTIGQLQLELLNYVEAAVPYQELMTRARDRGDRQQEFDYLQELAFIYTQGKQHQQAIAVRQRLVEFYVNAQQMTAVPELKLAIAFDYQALGQLQEAVQNYQEAYKLAWSLQQYAISSQALQQLGILYRSSQQLDAALQVYQALLIVDQRAYNLYGMMSSYDQIGKIHRARKAYTQALGAFQKGLELARQLRYQEAYFAKQIEQTVQQSP